MRYSFMTTFTKWILMIFRYTVFPFVGEPIEFPITVQPARNFPVDIYLLMDLSFSMNDDLENLKLLGAQLGIHRPSILQLSIILIYIFI